MAPRSGDQYKLFETDARTGNGFIYRPDFITPDEEELLITFIQALPLAHATGGESGEYKANRRHANFGWSYDFKNKRLISGPPLPRFLQRFARKIAKWLDIPQARVVEALVNEYTPGTGLGWHRDNENFEHVIGISLGGWCRMRFRLVTPEMNRGGPIGEAKSAKKIFALELEPRSVYLMQGDMRWKHQHSVAPTKTLRYSITFRTLPKEMRTPRRI